MDVMFDETVIEMYAARLYAQARSLAIVHTLVGLVVGAALGYTAATTPRLSATFLVPILAVVGTLAGYAVGTTRGFALRLQAQQALCQLQVERNTRCTFEALHARVQSASNGPLR
jgi:hypothetical protein